MAGKGNIHGQFSHDDKPFSTEKVPEEHLMKHEDDKSYQCGAGPNHSIHTPLHISAMEESMVDIKPVYDTPKAPLEERYWVLLIESSPMRKDMLIEQPAGYGLNKHQLSADKTTLSWKCKAIKCKGRIRTSSDYILEGDKNRIIPLKIVTEHTCAPNANLFNEISALQAKLKVHAAGVLHQCSYCEKSFSRESHFKKHTRTHTGEKPFPCFFCKKAFAENHSLTIHLRTHTGERPYICGYCEEAFTTNSILKNHVMKHTGEKPYQCKFCGKGFIETSNLKKHTRTHTGEKPYRCSQCKKYFTNNEHLKTHLKTHIGENPYQCSQSEMFPPHHSHLNYHLKTHTGEKTYPCRLCDETFISQGELNFHLRTHTLEITKPFKAKKINKINIGDTNESKVELNDIISDNIQDTQHFLVPKHSIFEVTN